VAVIVRIVFLAVFMVLFAAACRSVPVKEQTEVVINPSLIYEDCMELQPGEVLAYDFDCIKSVNFTIRYRQGDHITYKITKNNTTIHRDTFYADKKEIYCLSWANPHSSPTRLTYSYRVMKAR